MKCIIPKTHHFGIIISNTGKEKKRQSASELLRMADDDDDDDEAFGDFTIANNNAPTSSSKNDAGEEDDEWGDFVTPKSESAANQSSPWSDRVGTDRGVEGEKGVRARGALPLSIFGEEDCDEVAEKEEEKGSGGGGIEFGGGDVFRGDSGDLGRKGSDLRGLGISNLLASLYDQGGGGGDGRDGMMKDGNFVDRKVNGLKKESDELDLHSNGFVNGFSSTGGADSGKMMDFNESLFSFDGMNSGSDGFSSSAKAFNQDAASKFENGRRTKPDESAFNFLMTSSGSDVFSFGGKPSNAAATVNTDNGWNERTHGLDFCLNTSELGNDLGSIGNNVEVNGSKLGTKSSCSEDNDDDGWEFQGNNTNVTKKQEDESQREIASTNMLNNGSKLDAFMSQSGPDVQEDETRGNWEFQEFAAPTAKYDSIEIWDFRSNGVRTTKESNDSVWDSQVVAFPTAKVEHDNEWAYVGNSNTSVEEEDDDGWEFQVAPVDQNPKQEWNTGAQGFGAQGATLRSDTQVAGSQHEGSQIISFMPKLDSGIDDPTSVSAPSGHDFGFDSFVSSSVLPSESFDNSVYEANQYETENQSASAGLNGSVDADDSNWDFKDSSPETNLKNELNKAYGGQQGALPHSLFSDEPLDIIDSLNQDVFSFNPSHSHRSDFKNSEPSASLSDLILNLYNQSEKKSSVESPQQPTSSSDAIAAVNDSPYSNDEDDFDGTWDFKDASLTSVADNQSSYQVHRSSYTVSKMENLVDFYCKLRDQSSLAAMCHLASLKEAKSIAEHANDSEMEALDVKIQDALVELNKANVVIEDAPEDSTPDNCLKEFYQALSEPLFQLLESEYGLSRRLSTAEKELKQAIELVQHATLILDVLSTGSVEQQSNYISTWTKILVVCTQELQHGSSIWQRAVEKNVHYRILSQTAGKTFVRALGEIFRVVLILEVSSKAYRPWILSNSTDDDSVFTLLNECSALWTSSGLNDALKDLSDPADSEFAGEVRALLESISHIHELDVPTGYVSSQDSVCGLSLLNEAIIPDVKMVVWNGEQFFLPLANFWANLISSDPPCLPRIHTG